MERKELIARVATLALVLASCAAPPKHEATVPIAVGAAGSLPVGEEVRDDALRERALAALDTGDLDAAEIPLRELVRRHPAAVGTLGLLDAIESCTGRSRLENHAFAHLKPVDVEPLPAPSRPGKPARLTAKVGPRETPEPDRDAAVFAYPTHPMWPGDRGRVQRAASAKKPDATFLPERLGGNLLMLTKWTGSRWLALYGRGRNDGRFVAITDAEGRPLGVLDFRAWRTKRSLVEAGVAAMDMAGDVLYVRQEGNATDGFIAAIDTRTGKALWQTEPVGMGTRFVVGDEHVFIWTYDHQGFQVYERSTGGLAARVLTPYVTFALVPDDGVLVGYAGGPGLGKSNRVEIRTNVRHVDPPAKLPDPPVATRRLPASTSIGADARARSAGYATLDDDKPLEAMLALRSILDRNPHNFAVEALYDGARGEIERRRIATSESFKSAPATVVTGTKANTRAPIERTGPPMKLRLLEEKETRRHPSGWFVESGLTPTMFERDESPSALPIVPAPLWFPTSYGALPLRDDVTSGAQTVAVYGDSAVGLFRDEKPVATLVFGRDGTMANVSFADGVGGVVVASIRDHNGKEALVAIDAKSGHVYWRTPDIGAGSFVFVRGYIIASQRTLGRKAELVVLEGDTGRVVSRLTTPLADLFTYRLVVAGNLLWGFNVITTGRFAME